MRRAVTVGIVGLLAVAAIGAVPVGDVPLRQPADGCVAGDLDDASRTLVDDRARVVRTERLGGLETALVLEPALLPAIRHRLIDAAGWWCDVAGFNHGWSRTQDAASAPEVATAFAHVAAAPYMDGLSVRSVTVPAPGLVEIETHARTNGIVADWQILVDDAGVRRASWTATDFAVEPFDPQLRGITALPGTSRTFTRVGGSLHVDEAIPLDGPDAEQSLYTEGETEDGFTIRISLGNSTVSPDPDEDVGHTQVDFMRFVLRATLDNYSAHHRWGLGQTWTDDLGYVYVDDAISALCLACVVISETFNIHINRAIVPAAGALGYHYPDDDLLYSDVLGHELFHNFQLGYAQVDSKPTPHFSYAEGTARFQETLHDYSWISHQPQSLIYANDSNGCNGFDGSDRDAAMHSGPVEGHSYNACYFWLTWYARNGTEALVDLVKVMGEHSEAESDWAWVRDAIESATGEPVEEDLANFARMTLTRDGYAFPAGDGTGEAIDWSLYLEPWRVDVLARGDTATEALTDGGVMAREIRVGGTAAIEGPPDAALYLLRDDGAVSTVERIADGDTVQAPASGERLWLIGVYAGDFGQVTLGLE